MKKHVLIAMVLAMNCIAFTNPTDAYTDLINGRPFEAVYTTFEQAFGGGTRGQFFYFLTIMLPYSMLLIALKDSLVPNTLLLFFLTMYWQLMPAVAWQTIIIMLALGIMGNLWRVFSSYQTTR